ncbi:MAG: hypothetical protein J6S14_03495 [Clostridia bacterium]|nr:hypothetical protein [Clostridia bacterium]
MFDLFSKKKIDIEAAKYFWVWFEEQEEWIIANWKTSSMDVLNAIYAVLDPVFPYEKKNGLEFQFGFHDGKGEFEFFHARQPALKRDAETLKSMMPEKIAERWTFIIDK